MTIELWCLALAGLFHVLSKAPLVRAQAACAGGYDNRQPRAQQASLTGRGERALAVHQNQIESFPLFAAGVLVATATGANSPWVGYLAVAYLLARVVYLFLYLGDIATLRSAVWLVGYASSLALMLSPAWA